MADIAPMMRTISTSLSNAKTSLPTTDSISQTKDGISLLSLKSHLLLSYLQHTTFYIFLKLRGARIDEGEYRKVVERLIDLRVYLDKGVKPIEAKLRYQIDKVIRASERLDREGQMKDLDDNARDALAYKPNPKALVVEQEEEEGSRDGIYRPPRIASVLPVQDRKERRKMPNNTLREFVDSELSAAPVAEPSIGSNIISQGRQGNSVIQSSRDRASQAERDRYEEENYLRLPTTGKQKKGRRNDDIYGGEDFRVLDEELYDFDKGQKASLVERSRKRAQEEREDVDAPLGPTSNGKFKKRKQVLASRSKGRK